MALSPIGDMGIALKADVDDYQKSMATASDATGMLGSSIRSMTAMVRNMGLAMTVGSALAGGAMVVLAQRAERTAEAFREVETISSEVSNAQAEYGDLISDINTKFGIQAGKLEIIEGLYQSISAGVKEGAEAQRVFLETATELAVVGGTDLATSVDVLSTMINAYGEDTQFAVRASNALFRTVLFGKTRLEELAPVMGRVTALGAEMGVEIEELGSSMAVLTRIGFESRVAATGLRNVIRSLMRPGEKMQEMLRSIALEQNLFADSMGEGADQVRGLAKEYKEARKAIKKLEDAQKSARETVSEASLKIQKARLKIQAIEEDRLDQLPELNNEQIKQAETVEELNEYIEKYRFQVNKARVAEEEARQKQADREEQAKSLREEFKNMAGVEGDLGNNIGRLVVENENLIGTLTKLREKADEQNVAFSEIFPRTRALQAALALVGEDADLLNEIFKTMNEEGVEEGVKLLEKHREELEMTDEEFNKVKNDLQSTSEAYEKFIGGAQKTRNAMAKLNETLTELGRIFQSDVFGFIGTLSEKLTTLKNSLENMDEETRNNISRFMMLAVGIGLVLGPLLFFGGQIALIVSTLGTALLPLLIVAVGVFGSLAYIFSEVVGGGEESKNMLETLSNAFKSLISFVLFIFKAFKNIVGPALEYVGETIGSLAGTITEKLGENEDVMTFREVLVEAMWAIRDALNVVGDFISENEELIASLVVMAVEVIQNVVIPNLMDFAKGLLAVLANIDYAKFTPLIAALAFIAVQFIKLLGWVGRFMSKHGEFIGKLVTWAVILGSIAFAAIKVVTAIGILSVKVSAAIGFIKGLAAVMFIAYKTVGITSVVISSLASAFPMLAAGISTILTFVGYLVAGLKLLVIGFKIVAAAIAGVISIKVILIAALIAIIVAFWFARDEIIKAVKGLVNFVLLWFENLYKAITGEISWEEAGRNIIKNLANGIYGGKKLAEKAMASVMKGIKSFIPSSPAEKGPFSEMSPEDYGKGISSDFAEGIELSTPEVEEASLNMSKAAKPDMRTIEEDTIGGVSLGGYKAPEKEQSMSSMGGFGGGQTIEISDKAVFFEAGAFQGVSDEELPEKVRDVVDNSMDEIIDELEAKGVDVE